MQDQPLPCAERRPVMRADDVRSNEFLRHGAYICLRRSAGARPAAAVPVPALADRLGLRNEFEPGAGPPGDAIAFLRRVRGPGGELAGEGRERGAGAARVESASWNVGQGV